LAVLKTELNWSTYQQKQLSILQDLEKSFARSLRISEHLATTMNKVEYSIKSIAIASENSAKNIQSITQKLLKNYETLEQTTASYEAKMREAGKSLGGFSVRINSAGESAERSGRQVEQAGGRFASVLDSTSNLLSNYWDHLGRLEGVGREIDKFSDASNQMIKLSGMSGDIVREFRGEIMSTVAELNVATGSAFSPQESYGQIISIFQGVTSNLDAIEEMAKPMLLTQETLDVNINTVADIFNKFYTRYNFSSMHMEDALDEIRGNTAGNSANAEATLENLKTLEHWINNYAGDNNELREELIERTSHFTSWLESMNMDSGPFAAYMKNVADSVSNVSQDGLQLILSRVGIGALEAQNLARSGEYEYLTSNIVEGIYAVMSDFDSNRDGRFGEGEAVNLSKMLENYGISMDLAMEVWNLKNSDGWTSLEDFIEKNSDKSSAEELVADKYVSMANKTNHWLEQIYAVTASIQELLPFGFSDIALAIALLGGTGSGGGLGGRAVSGMRSIGMQSMYRGIFSTPRSLGGVTQGLSRVAGIGGGIGGAAMLGGGVVAGGALAFDGFSDMVDTGNSTGTRVLGGLEGGLGVAGAGTLLAAGVTNPVGWALLAAGGLAALGKVAYENATALGGNAQAAVDELAKIEKSLQEENQQRFTDILDLSYNFNKETDIEKQRQLLLEAGIAEEEELRSMQKDQMSNLIKEYQSAASAMTTITDNILGEAERYTTEKHKEQQSKFLQMVEQQADTPEERLQFLNMIKSSVTDEDTRNKIDKVVERGWISDDQWNDILMGGQNWLWDKHHLGNTTINATDMNRAATYLGGEANYSNFDEIDEATELWNKYQEAIIYKNRKSADEIWKEILDKDYDDEVAEMFGATGPEHLHLPAYRQGTNYITKDHIALLHEGEAVVPKKYNPAVNSKELQYLTEYLTREQENTQREYQESKEYLISFIEEMREIRMFLSLWKEENNLKERLSSAHSKHNDINKVLLRQYLSMNT